MVFDFLGLCFVDLRSLLRVIPNVIMADQPLSKPLLTNGFP